MQASPSGDRGMLTSMWRVDQHWSWRGRHVRGAQSVVARAGSSQHSRRDELPFLLNFLNSCDAREIDREEQRTNDRVGGGCGEDLRG